MASLVNEDDVFVVENDNSEDIALTEHKSDKSVPENYKVLRVEKTLEDLWRGVSGCSSKTDRKVQELFDRFKKGQTEGRPGAIVKTSGWTGGTVRNRSGTRNWGARWCSTQIFLNCYIEFYIVEE
ncbi:hypothetical protein HUO14_03740 [Parasphingorhabdus flavimaris]|uniref:Uncharacterized protein n=1 Tax=Parasphingorhabdus flavimaris TaxID=266812 RepID=A0ABX2MZY9_9SPHN|nr:hypothetical protein [Parasphingorhabdus flavimaris]NVD27020.1 hypothetical protein [Parasphingorhabdus flavimaris]